MAEPNGKQVTVPYIPYKTFIAVLDSLVKFLPDSVDTSLWGSYSGGIKSQLISSLKFLGLITEAKVPTEDLKRMSENPDSRQAVMKEVLRRSYPALFALDLAKATPASFDKILRDEYKQDGETHRKAASFFLIAAKNAGIPLSPPLTAKGRLSIIRKKSNNSQGRPKPNMQDDPVQDSTELEGQSGPWKTISLGEDLTLTLSASKDSFHMSKESREFVFKLLDLMEEFDQSSPDEEDEEA